MFCLINKSFTTFYVLVMYSYKRDNSNTKNFFVDGYHIVYLLIITIHTAWVGYYLGSRTLMLSVDNIEVKSHLSFLFFFLIDYIYMIGLWYITLRSKKKFKTMNELYAYNVITFIVVLCLTLSIFYLIHYNLTIKRI
jgi:magnesium-transporting ATPase (P-type)